MPSCTQASAHRVLLAGHSLVAPQVWDASSPGHICWDARDTGAERMGVVSENILLQAALLAAAERAGGRTEFIWPAEVKALRLPSDGPGPGPAASASASGPAATSTASQGSAPHHGLAEVRRGLWDWQGKGPAWAGLGAARVGAGRGGLFPPYLIRNKRRYGSVSQLERLNSTTTCIGVLAATKCARSHGPGAPTAAY